MADGSQFPPAGVSAEEGAERRAARAALFSTEILRRIDAIARASGTGDRAGIVAEANALAAGALALGLSALATEAAETERAARSGDAARMAEALRVLQCGVHDALALLRRGG
jgi:HPt (histidine-containing phosphotransfer) domain-containing protein